MGNGLGKALNAEHVGVDEIGLQAFVTLAPVHVLVLVLVHVLADPLKAPASEAPENASRSRSGEARKMSHEGRKAKRDSNAEARDQLPRVAHDAESGHPAELTRRGKPDAVILIMLAELPPGMRDACNA